MLEVSAQYLWAGSQKMRVCCGRLCQMPRHGPESGLSKLKGCLYVLLHSRQ